MFLMNLTAPVGLNEYEYSVVTLYDGAKDMPANGDDNNKQEVRRRPTTSNHFISNCIPACNTVHFNHWKHKTRIATTGAHSTNRIARV